MTNTVKRGAGRPAHAERTNRHAQRTPLPPRAGQVAEAREAVAEAQERKSPAKAMAFIQEADKLGWVATGKDYQATSDTAALTVSRDGEDVTIVWERGVFQSADYTGHGRQLKLNNASAAKRRMGMAPEMAVQEAAKVAAAPRPGTPRPPRVAKSRALPFSGESLDEEVIDAVRGKQIAWTNRISGVDEEDFVRPKHIRMIETPGGRALSFMGGRGFRSVLVAAIIRVR